MSIVVDRQALWNRFVSVDTLPCDLANADIHELAASIRAIRDEDEQRACDNYESFEYDVAACLNDTAFLTNYGIASNLIAYARDEQWQVKEN